jgi:hypothetical protein
VCGSGGLVRAYFITHLNSLILIDHILSVPQMTCVSRVNCCPDSSSIYSI